MFFNTFSDNSISRTKFCARFSTKQYSAACDNRVHRLFIHLSAHLITLEDILDFHYRFERIRAYAENNGLIGRLLIFKECLRNGITPFIIDSSDRQRYFDGSDKWERDRRELIDLCLDAQVKFRRDLNI